MIKEEIVQQKNIILSAELEKEKKNQLKAKKVLDIIRKN
jgi:hypothetical protein